MKQVLPNALGAMMPAVAAKSGNPLAAMMLMNGGQEMNPLMAMAMMGNGNIGGQFRDQYGAMERPGVGTTEQPFTFGNMASGGDYAGNYTPSGDTDLESVVGGIIQNESGGDPSARNPYGSAGGLGQFIDSTWMGMLRKHRPDLASRPDALKLKYDPDLNREMTRAYVSENIDGLKAAGLYRGPGDAYIAHFLGLGGAKNVLSKPPGTPLTAILSEEIFKANPMRWRGKGLREMTVGELRQMFAEKMAG